MKKIQLTNAHKEKLFQIPLFRDLPLNIKESLLDKLDFVIYAADKKEIVVTQGTPCNKLYVLLEGKLRTDIIDGLGNEVMIEYIIAPRTFATPHLFNSNNTLPATFTALEDSVVLMATKDSTFKVISQDAGVAQFSLHRRKLQYMYRITFETSVAQDCTRKVYCLLIRT